MISDKWIPNMIELISNIKKYELLRWLCNAGMFDNSISQICPGKHFQILVRINLNYKHLV